MLHHFQLLFFFVIFFIMTSCSAPNTATHKWRSFTSVIWTSPQVNKDGWIQSLEYLQGLPDTQFRWRIIIRQFGSSSRGVFFYSDGSGQIPEFIIPGTRFVCWFYLTKDGTNKMDFSTSMQYNMEFLTENTAQSRFKPDRPNSSSNPHVRDYGSFYLKGHFLN